MSFDYIYIREMKEGWEWKVSNSPNPATPSPLIVGHTIAWGWQLTKEMALDAAEYARQELLLTESHTQPIGEWQSPLNPWKTP
jgi:hypothetical protein